MYQSIHQPLFFSVFFFNYPATTEIYTLSLHDALPISFALSIAAMVVTALTEPVFPALLKPLLDRSEEHTSELQSHVNLVCRLLLEKKKKQLELQERLTKDRDNFRAAIEWLLQKYREGI